MSSLHIRPRFEQVVDLHPEAVRERILEELDGEDQPFEVKIFPDFICLRIQESDRHFWSPRLNISLDDAEGGKTRVNGTYGPNANVWGLFLYVYLLAGLFATIATVLTISQWMIDHKPWGLWFMGITYLAIIVIYAVAKFGQKLGAQQTFLIHQAYESALGTHVEVH